MLVVKCVGLWKTIFTKRGRVRGTPIFKLKCPLLATSPTTS